MKQAVGIVVEYNPFHNGHKYHCLKAREHGDIVIAVMSGDYVQRGEPALIDRWTRAELALKNGVDIVVELPTFYSTQSAEIFARGSVGILNLMNVKKIVFGSETGDTLNLIKRAKLEEREDFKEELKRQLKEGYSYPTAYSNSLKKIDEKEELNSNDILGVEYIKALDYWKSNMEPIAIKREKSGYYSEGIEDGISSATGIRKKLYDGEEIKEVVPVTTYEVLKNALEKNQFAKLKDFYPFLRYKILLEKERLEDIQDIEIGYGNRIYEAAFICENFDTFFEKIKSKRYTLGRIQRVLIHILLGIKKDQTEKVKNKIPYIRVLGFTKDGQSYLKNLKEQEVQILTSLKNIQKKLDEDSLKLLEQNEVASKIYTMVNHYEERKIPIIIK
ncbi:nucleotidyltransferase [Candidatus Cetobacterium colombiensis]|uniref:tRNA(Met) cytidine acetate ligase n=1 Tax=Candidatus Cetobacterium colombiensis TaxID=3073100 RepID=A0ABU4W941_9FUSO|nr:nucleotidyltransferase [Candidatus Cetobacterium colombiensis]MDX8335675.1 nucleotidyltransferase [Candidatus Cetobacterium colombiensis]